jgi:hypothetical protein
MMVCAAAWRQGPQTPSIQGIKAKILEYWDIRQNDLKKGRNTFLAGQKSLTING